MPAGTATARAAGGVATDGATDGVTAAAGVTGATGGATETNATSSTSNAGGNSIWIPMPTPNSNGTNRNAGNNDGQGGDNRSDILRNSKFPLHFRTIILVVLRISIDFRFIFRFSRECDASHDQ